MNRATSVVPALLLTLAACGGADSPSTPTGPGTPTRTSHNAGNRIRVD